MCTLVNGLYEGWIVDVARCKVSKLATQQLEVFLINVQCEQMEDSAKLHRCDHTTVAVGLEKEIKKKNDTFIIHAVYPHKNLLNGAKIR